MQLNKWFNIEPVEILDVDEDLFAVTTEESINYYEEEEDLCYA